MSLTLEFFWTLHHLSPPLVAMRNCSKKIGENQTKKRMVLTKTEVVPSSQL